MRSSIRSTDAEGKVVPKEIATGAIISEYDENGQSVRRTYGTFNPRVGPDEVVIGAATGEDCEEEPEVEPTREKPGASSC